MRKRWDNTAHHPEVPTSPPHVHYDEETNVIPCKPVTAEEVLAIIAAEITNQEL
ncbi:MAG: DUF6516 family protein [Bacillota bacterium]